MKTAKPPAVVSTPCRKVTACGSATDDVDKLHPCMNGRVNITNIKNKTGLITFHSLMVNAQVGMVFSLRFV